MYIFLTNTLFDISKYVHFYFKLNHSAFSMATASFSRKIAAVGYVGNTKVLKQLKRKRKEGKNERRKQHCIRRKAKRIHPIESREKKERRKKQKSNRTYAHP